MDINSYEFTMFRIETDKHIILPHSGKIYNKKSMRFCEHVHIDKRPNRYNQGYKEFKLNGKMVRNHRYIYELYHNTKIPKGMQINHINEDKLDNRISNLELVTHQQNQQAITIHNRNTSGYKGVYWAKDRNKWRVQISFNRKHINYGHYTDIKDAARAYNFYAEFLNNTKGCKYILNKI